MINILIKDLQREITTAEAEETAAQNAYKEEIDDALTKRQIAVQERINKLSLKASLEKKHVDSTRDLQSGQKQFLAVANTPSDLHAECDWLLKYHEIRKAARDEEIENLTVAKGVLSGADFSFLQRH